MADKMTQEQRHRCMSRIRGKDTKPELTVRRYLHAHGYRFRLHVDRLPGHPDIVMRRLRTVILVNGCFWHGHMIGDGATDGRQTPCRYFKMPSTNRAFWEAKIERNRARDGEERARLTQMGWNVIQIWECQLKPAVREQTLTSLMYTLNQIELKVSKSVTKEAPAIAYDYEQEPKGLNQWTMVADESDDDSAQED